MRLIVVLFLLTPLVHVFAQSQVVSAEHATVYDSAKPGAKVIGRIPKGKKVQVTEEEVGFGKLTSKSGRAMWVRLSELSSESDVSSDLTDENESAGASPSAHRLTWDLGASAGSYRGYSYTEIDLGLNWYLMEWLVWRNAAFARFVQPKNVYGLDSSLRVVLSPNFMNAFGVTVFAGPGARFVTEGNSVPFAEGGLVLHVAGFNLGGGIKTLFHSFYDQGLADDTQYFIILSGAGSF